jgi:Ca-activated chloride channel homolog
MDGLTFLRPQAGWLLVGAAVLLMLVRVLRRRPYVAVGIGSLLTGRAFRASRLRRLPRMLAGAALIAIVLALMDPVIPNSEAHVTSQGIDIVVVLDLSVSMEEIMGGAGSGGPELTRLEVTKRAITDFVGRRSGDRIGLVVFSENAYVVSPLTVDHDYVRRYVSLIDDQALRGEGLTAIGEGLTIANALLERQAVEGTHRSQVIVVLTDGENTHGRDPVEALEESHQAGHRVHLVGIDLEEEIKRKPDVRRLVRRVQSRGGQYFVADTSGELTAASRAIDALEKGTLVSRRTEHNAPVFEIFAGAAIVLMGAALLLRSLPYFVDLT